MKPNRRPTRTIVAGVAVFAFVAAACGGDDNTDDAATSTSAAMTSETTAEFTAEPTATTDAMTSETTEAMTATTTAEMTSDTTVAESEMTGGTVEVTDFEGTVEVPVPAERIVVTDNRIVRAVDSWGVELVAAPLAIFPETISYASDDSVLDLGAHREPDLEALVAADPDLVLSGYRFESFEPDIRELVPDAAFVDTTTDYENAGLADELIRQITLTGKALQHEAEAQALVAEFETSIENAKAAYDSSETVMGLLTSGGDISYVAPTTGRAIGPVFDVLGLTPALDQAGGSADTGDDISVEAIAAANPDWLFVLDRDAAISTDTEEYASAEELILGSEALANVTAVKEGNIVYLPADFYLTEDIQAYTEFFNAIADAMSAG